jgi:hypothetical protein
LPIIGVLSLKNVSFPILGSFIVFFDVNSADLKRIELYVLFDLNFGNLPPILIVLPKL